MQLIAPQEHDFQEAHLDDMNLTPIKDDPNTVQWKVRSESYQKVLLLDSPFAPSPLHVLIRTASPFHQQLLLFLHFTTQQCYAP